MNIIERAKGWLGNRVEVAPDAPRHKNTNPNARHFKLSARSITGWPNGADYGGGGLGGGYFDADTNRTLSGWPHTSQSPDFHIYHQLEPLRARSRDLVRRSSHGKKMVALLVKGLVGPHGIRANARVTRGMGGQTIQDTAVNEAIEAAWKDWCQTPMNCDHKEGMTFKELQQMAVRSWATDGEFFIRIHKGKGAGPYGLRLELIDAENVDIHKSESTPDGGQIRLGVEYDSEGRKVRYHFRNRNHDTNFGGSYTYGYGSVYTIEAKHIIQGYMPDFADQSRGVPLMHAALADMKHMDMLIKEALVRARISASSTVMLSSPDDEHYTGDTEAEDGATERTLSAGTVTDIGNRTANMMDADFPSAMFDDFVKSIQRRYAAGMDTSYAALTGDLADVNFSSIRAGLLEDRDKYTEIQTWLIDKLIRPVYMAWLDMAIMSGQITIRGKPLSRPMSHYAKADFQGRRWGWVNPQQDARAHEIMLANGLTSRQQICNERGIDFEQVVSELAREKEMMDESGLDIGMPPTGQEIIPDDDEGKPPPKK